MCAETAVSSAHVLWKSFLPSTLSECQDTIKLLNEGVYQSRMDPKLVNGLYERIVSCANKQPTWPKVSSTPTTCIVGLAGQ